MPPICFHLGVARAAALRLARADISHNLGAYYLGATSPDIRLMTGALREDTHFFDLGGEASSVPRFFEKTPALAQAGALSPEARAFVAGYLSHLVADEAWIRGVYRPAFGQRSPLGQDPQAPLLDRVLQFELDRRQRSRKEEMGEVRGVVCQAVPLPDMGFLDAASLERWRDFVCRAAGREPTWERFGAFARSVLAPREELSPDTLQALLERACRAVSPQRLAEFQERAVADSVAAAEDYLAGHRQPG